METLGALESRGVIISPENYCLATLAQNTLAELSNTKNEIHKLDSKKITKLILHIELIDKFLGKILVETKVEETLFQKWERDITQMNGAANTITDETLRTHAQNYVDSWKDFLCMYLLFKRAYDGTI